MHERTSQPFTDVVLPEASTRTVTGDGYLVASAVLAGAGVFKYRASELGLTDRNASQTVSVFRSADELAKAIESFEAQTITLDHKWTTATNWRGNAIGDVRDVEMRGDAMAGTVIIRDAAAIAAIRDGRSEFSNGYSGFPCQVIAERRNAIFDSRLSRTMAANFQFRNAF